jgi:hypothetical protein
MSEPQRLAPAVPPLRRVGGLGMAATVMICLVVILEIASTWTTWNGYWALQDYLAGESGVTDADLDSADDLVSTVSTWYLVAFVASAVVFVIWLWQARENAERLCQAPHRRAHGWVIGSWICPVVNLWFPFMVVDDVYRASRPDNKPYLHDLRSVPGSHLLALWWALWLGSLALDRIFASMWNNAVTPEALHSAGVVELLGSAVTLGAAATIIPVVRQISGWQDRRPTQAA